VHSIRDFAECSTKCFWKSQRSCDLECRICPLDLGSVGKQLIDLAEAAALGGCSSTVIALLY